MLLVGRSFGGDMQTSKYSSLFSTMHLRMLEIFPDLLERAVHKLEMLESPAEYRNLGNYALTKVLP